MKHRSLPRQQRQRSGPIRRASFVCPARLPMASPCRSGAMSLACKLRKRPRISSGAGEMNQCGARVASLHSPHGVGRCANAFCQIVLRQVPAPTGKRNRLAQTGQAACDRQRCRRQRPHTRPVSCAIKKFKSAYVASFFALDSGNDLAIALTLTLRLGAGRRPPITPWGRRPPRRSRPWRQSSGAPPRWSGLGGARQSTPCRRG